MNNSTLHTSDQYISSNGNNYTIPHNSLLALEPPPEQTIQIEGTAYIAVAITDASESG